MTRAEGTREGAETPKGYKDGSSKGIRKAWRRGGTVGGWLSPHRCWARRRRPFWEEGPARVHAAHNPLDHSSSLTGPWWNMPTPLKTQAKPHPTITPAKGNDRSLPGQPRVPTSGQGVSEGPCATTLKRAAAPTHQFQKAPLHTGFPGLASDRVPAPHCQEILLCPSLSSSAHSCVPSPSPRGGHPGGGGPACRQELPQKTCPK